MSDNDEKILPILRWLLIAFFGLLLVLALQLFLLVTRADAATTIIGVGYPQLNGGQTLLWNIPENKIDRQYAKNSSPVSKGDLYYNFIDHNLTGGETQQIDTSRIAVYLMTGEYDWGNSPDQTRILAEQINGSKFVEMKSLGHFPMAENFAIFKKYLMPILNEIAKNGER